jgi:ATP-dependent exoDNAse (exonuclease V) alpha subunit
MDFQLISMRNDDRTRLNELVEELCFTTGLLNRPPTKTAAVKLSARVSLFPGKKIIFLARTKPHTSSSLGAFEGVRNGELCQIRTVQHIGAKGDDVLLVTTAGKRVLISKSKREAVRYNQVDSAYCITSNKAQGSQWAHVLVWLPGVQGFFTREHAYVACSRARYSVTLLGTPNELAALCRSKSRTRSTLLSRLLRQAFVFPTSEPERPQGLRPLEDLLVLGPHQAEAATLYPRMVATPAPQGAQGEVGEEKAAKVKKPARKRTKK